MGKPDFYVTTHEAGYSTDWFIGPEDTLYARDQDTDWSESYETDPRGTMPWEAQARIRDLLKFMMS